MALGKGTGARRSLTDSPGSPLQGCAKARPRPVAVPRGEPQRLGGAAGAGGLGEPVGKHIQGE